MNHDMDNQQFKTDEEALAFVMNECTFNYNTGQTMAEALLHYNVDVDAVLGKLDVTGCPKSGYVIRQAFRTAINDAAMNPLRQAAAPITFVSYTPAGTPKPPVKKPVTFVPPRLVLARAAKKKPVVYYPSSDDDDVNHDEASEGENYYYDSPDSDTGEHSAKPPSSKKPCVRVAPTAKSARVLAADLKLDSSCAACEELRKKGPKSHPKQAHTCGREIAKRLGPVGKCMLTGKDKWSFVADVVFMTKAAVPKVLNRPGSHGCRLLLQSSDHFQKHHVYETTDAHGNIVYWAHEGSL